MSERHMRRQGDQGAVGKTKSFMQEWGWAFYIVGGILLALGFKYTTPKDAIDSVNTEITSMKTDINALKNVTITQASDINAITRLQCFNENYTTRQLNLVGIKCDGIR